MKISERQRSEVGTAMNYEIEEQAATRRYRPLKQAFAEIGIGTTMGYRLINEGLIRALKLRRRTFVDMQSVAQMFESLPELRPASQIRVLSARDLGLADQDTSPEAL